MSKDDARVTCRPWRDAFPVNAIGPGPRHYPVIAGQNRNGRDPAPPILLANFRAARLYELLRPRRVDIEQTPFGASGKGENLPVKFEHGGWMDLEELHNAGGTTEPGSSKRPAIALESLYTDLSENVNKA